MVTIDLVPSMIVNPLVPVTDLIVFKIHMVFLEVEAPPVELNEPNVRSAEVT